MSSKETAMAQCPRCGSAKLTEQPCPRCGHSVSAEQTVRTPPTSNPAKLAHQMALMCLTSLLKQFGDTMHRNQIADVRLAIDMNRMALGVTSR